MDITAYGQPPLPEKTNSATAALIGSLIAGIGTSAYNAISQKRNQRKQIDLANTAHQREVEDLKKSGLNPYLTEGSPGAATPGVMYNPSVDSNNILNSGLQGVQALSTAQQAKNQAKIVANTADETAANAKKAQSEALISSANQWYTETNLLNQKENLEADTQLKKQQAANAKNSAAISQVEADFYQTMGKWVPGAKWLKDVIPFKIPLKLPTKGKRK